MIGYRFLAGDEEGRSEAALFYEAASAGLGRDFLDDVAHALNRLRGRVLAASRRPLRTT